MMAGIDFDAYRLIGTVRRGEHWIFIYADTYEGRKRLCQTFGRYAASPDLSFGWGDCARLVGELQELQRRKGNKSP